MTRWARLTATISLLAGLAPAALAQDFNRPIHMVIAFPPGGPTDFVGRLVADKVKDILSQTIIIENKAGASGTIGADYVAKSPPDGTTLFLSTVGAIAINPHMRDNMPYSAQRDFSPITQVVNISTVMVVRSDHPANTLKEFVEYAKTKSGLPFGSTGVGSTTHLASELFSSAAGFKYTHVPYRGAAPAITDLLGGQIDAFFGDTPALIPQIAAGKLKPLAVAADRRNPALPDVPTLAELGYPNTTVDNWYGLFAPAKTPAPIVNKLHDAFVTAVTDPVIKEKLIKVGAISVGSTPADFSAFVQQQIAYWGKIVREKGIKEPAG